jgi:hypothetical protein
MGESAINQNQRNEFIVFQLKQGLKARSGVTSPPNT